MVPCVPAEIPPPCQRIRALGCACETRSPTDMCCAIESRISTAPIGYPFASGFAMVTMSGCASVGSDECAHSVPVLYRPLCA